jgi:N-acetyl sugar amidotransferase
LNKINLNYQICKNCVNDTSDPGITFDAEGNCDQCLNFKKNILPIWNYGKNQISKISKTIEKINCITSSNNCLIGISGGLDSSYLAYVAKKIFGLRPLLFHCDAGWNSERAVTNIEKITNGLGLDLVTEVVNWDEIKKLQLAFFKSSVASQDIPQDLVFFSSLYKFAKKNNFKYILTGGNYSMESIRGPIDYGYYATDLTFVKDIFKKFGEGSFPKLPMIDILNYQIYLRFFKGISMIKLLNYVPFVKKDAINTLSVEFDWKPFFLKHHESIFTRFYDAYYTKLRYNFDRRRIYYSAEILSNQMTRDDALDFLTIDTTKEKKTIEDYLYIAKKLDLNEIEFDNLIKLKPNKINSFKNKKFIINGFVKLSNILNIENRKFR